MVDSDESVTHAAAPRRDRAQVIEPDATLERLYTGTTWAE